MNLDSKLDQPEPIGDEHSLTQFLHSELSEGDKELFLVLRPDVYRDSTWKKEHYDPDALAETVEISSHLSKNDNEVKDNPSMEDVNKNDSVKRTTDDTCPGNFVSSNCVQETNER